ncbi:MAG: hypothetical protein RLZ44_1696, partial [Pseudomonadota bacterium]
MLQRLSLKYRVLLWVSLAVAAPMGLLVGSAVRYSQQLYANEVRTDVFGALDRTVAAVDRRQFVEHDLIRALSQVPAVTAMLPALHALRHGEFEGDFEALRQVASHFFETFQGVRRSLGTVRILDHRGDTLVKVRDGHGVPPVIENLDAIAVIENGSENPAFRAGLAALRDDDVGSLASPPGFDPLDAVLNTALPLLHQGQVVGYFLIGAPLEPLDRTLDIAARPRGAALLVAEINLDDAARHGMILYADQPELRLASLEPRQRLQDIEPRLLAEGFAHTEGLLRDGAGTAWYFRQHSPYPDRLLSWIVAYRLDSGAAPTPFWHADYVLWAVLLVALVVGLLLAQLVARQVTTPVARLAQRLSRYAEGERHDRLAPTGAPELRAAHTAFNQMADTLDRFQAERDQAQRAMLQSAKLTSIGQLAAGIAHELSNPLANIFSLTKLLQRHLPPDDAELRDDVDNIRSEAERASRIIRGLLDFARQGASHPSDFDLAAWLQESLALVERMAQRRDIALHLDCPLQLALHGDRGLLQQALVNVLINAVQVTPEHGTVQVSAAPTGPGVEIQVADQGPGIPAEAADRLFDPFFTTKPEGEGTGLGLS